VALMWRPMGTATPCARTRSVLTGGGGHERAALASEQVKRWAILPNDLSIERGDLTPNLKLKRHAVTQRSSL